MQDSSNLPIFERGGFEEASSVGRVWYAAYGSNVRLGRLRCYLRGEAPTELHLAHLGCRDSSDPSDDRLAGVRHGLVFAEHSTAWRGGVAFLDPDEESGMSYVRLWNLSSQQFEDIAAMENGLAPGTVAIDWNEFAQTGETRIAGGGWYTFGFGLGSFEGLPVVGFTCPNAGKTWAEPGPAYRAMIVSGLVEGGLDEDIAEAYGKAWSATELYKQ